MAPSTDSKEKVAVRKDGDRRPIRFFEVLQLHSSKWRAKDEWEVHYLPRGWRLALFVPAIYRIEYGISPEARKSLIDDHYAVAIEDGEMTVFARRYPPRLNPAPKKVMEKDPCSKKKKRGPVKNPCGFNGRCKAPARSCEKLKRHHWAPIPPPIMGGKEEIMTTPSAAPMGGPTLDPETWFRAHEGDNATEIRIEEIKSGVTMHSTEATVRRAEIDASVVNRKTDAEVTISGQKYGHLNHKVDVNAAAAVSRSGARARSDRFNTLALTLGLITAAAIVAIMAMLFGDKDNALPPTSTSTAVTQTLPPVEICARCGGSSCGGCDDGGDITNTITITIDGDDVVTGTTVPCDCTTTTTVPRSSTTTTTVPSTTTTTIPGFCSGDGCPTSTTIPGFCSGDGCPDP